MIFQIYSLILSKKFKKKISWIYYLKRRELGCSVNSFGEVKPLVWFKIDSSSFISLVTFFVIFFEKIFLIFILNRKVISCLEESFDYSDILVLQTFSIVLIFTLKRKFVLLKFLLCRLFYVFWWLISKNLFHESFCLADCFDFSIFSFKQNSL